MWFGEGGPPGSGWDLVEKAWHGCPVAARVKRGSLSGTGNRGCIEAWLSTLRATASEQAFQLRQHRRDAWHQWVQQCFARKPGRLYRWVRGTRETLPGLVQLAEPPEGCPPQHWTKQWVGAPVAELDALSKAWRGCGKNLYCRPRARHVGLRLMMLCRRRPSLGGGIWSWCEWAFVSLNWVRPWVSMDGGLASFAASRTASCAPRRSCLTWWRKARLGLASSFTRKGCWWVGGVGG